MDDIVVNDYIEVMLLRDMKPSRKSMLSKVNLILKSHNT